MDKEVLGQPLWLWGLGGVIVIGGYLYFRSHSASSASTPGTPQDSGAAPSSTSSFKEWIKQHNGTPTPTPSPTPKPKKHKKAA